MTEKDRELAETLQQLREKVRVYIYTQKQRGVTVSHVSRKGRNSLSLNGLQGERLT